MQNRRPKPAIGVISMIGLAGLMIGSPAWSQTHGAHSHPQSETSTSKSEPAPPGSVRITMEALHAAGGVPPGWRFTMPPGDPAAGRQAFVDLKCYACHAVQGEQFPLKPGETPTAGPDLTGMGEHHPAEYLAESIVNPSAVLIEGPGYIGGDGRSIMPAYPDMTLAQLANLVAYLKTLGAPHAGHAHEMSPTPAAPLEQVVGGYRVRLRYDRAGADSHQGHGGMAMKPAPGHVMVFLTDPGSGQPIPYMPVSMRIDAPGKPPQTLKLAPSLGPEGFHYGTEALIADGARITVSIGAAAMQLGPGAPEGLKRPQRVTFDWK